MTVVLKKGENVNLSKDTAGEATGLTKIVVGLGWDPNTSGPTADLDAMAFLLNEAGKVRSDKDFVFYGNLDGAAPAVKHSGDDLTGGNSEKGDDEQIQVDLSQIPADVHSVRFLVDIYEAAQKNQNLGQIKNAYIRLVNASTDEEIVRDDLTEDFSSSTDVMLAEIYRHNGDWKFKVLNEGSTKGSKQLASELGVSA